MMSTCPRCHCANPAEANFCHFDGSDLRASPAVVAAKNDTHLPHDFVFPSGRRCKSYDDLVQGCQEEWATACELLHDGSLRQFLAGAGRLDLAKAADEARGQPDPDLALDAFLNRLPATDAPKPRLELEPRRILLGQIRQGTAGNARLLVINQGRGLLAGTIAVTEGGDWLRLAGANASAVLALKTVSQQEVKLEVDARQLLAPQRYGGRLAVITNGGIVEVPVRLDVIAHPFPTAPFAGAASPRDMAVRMRGNPKAAAPLLENGDVARWFEANKWGYPVQGASARGMAAVQQFFESMGLAKAPRVALAETEVQFTCLYPETVEGQTTLQSPDRKWVYGQADSDAVWLTVTTPVVSGPQQAVIQFRVDSSLLDPNRRADGTIDVRGNGGQSLALRVRVDVRRPAEPPTHRLFRPLLVGALAGLLLRLALALPADIYARVVAAPPGLDVVAGSVAAWSQAPAGTAFVRTFALATGWLGAIVGAVLLARRRDHWADIPSGIIAGAGAGLAAAATFACFFPALDAPARLLWRGLSPALRGVGPITATMLWLAAALVAWTAVGAALGGLLGCLGATGRGLLGRVGASLAWLLGRVGLHGPARYVGSM